MSHVLRAVQAAAGHGDLVKRFSDRAIEYAAFDGEGRGAGIEPRAAVKLQRCPGHQPFTRELRKTQGVSGNPERLTGCPPGRLVLSMPVFGGPAENRDDDLGAKLPYHADDVLQNFFPGPVLPGLVHALGKAEVIRSGEVLARAIEVSC